jgi:hypothetical protein
MRSGQETGKPGNFQSSLSTRDWTFDTQSGIRTSNRKAYGLREPDFFAS